MVSATGASWRTLCTGGGRNAYCERLEACHSSQLALWFTVSKNHSINSQRSRIKWEGLRKQNRKQKLYQRSLHLTLFIWQSTWNTRIKIISMKKVLTENTVIFETGLVIIYFVYNQNWLAITKLLITYSFLPICLF